MAKELSYLEAIREALVEEMRRDPKVFVLGEDVGAYGGAFGVTQGLFDEFGEMRVHRHADLRVGDHRRQHRRVAARLPAGGGDAVRRLHLAAASIRSSTRRRRCATATAAAPRCRSSCGRRAAATSAAGCITRRIPKAWFIHRPGLKVVAPSTAVRRQGAAEGGDSRRQPGDLLRAQVSLSPRQGAGARRATRSCRSASPRSRREGSDITLLTYGAMVHAVARGGRSAGEGRRRGRGDRPAHADAVRQGGDLRVGREDQPRC